MDLKGDFTVIEFTIGKRKEDYSYARLLVKGNSKEHLSGKYAWNLFFEKGQLPFHLDEVKCYSITK